MTLRFVLEYQESQQRGLLTAGLVQPTQYNVFNRELLIFHWKFALTGKIQGDVDRIGAGVDPLSGELRIPSGHLCRVIALYGAASERNCIDFQKYMHILYRRKFPASV